MATLVKESGVLIPQISNVQVPPQQAASDKPHQQPTEKSGWWPYGFKQLQHFHKRSTTIGFTLAMAGLASTLTVHHIWFTMKLEAERTRAVGVTKVRLSNLPPPPSQAMDALPPPPPPSTVSSGPAARAGTPVPVPDALITPDMKDFANVQEVSRASSKGGDGNDAGFLGLATENIEVEVHSENEPDAYEFIAVDKEPYIDVKDLQAKVVYPEVARRANISGKVLLRVLVLKTGMPKRCIVENSDSELLDAAAIKAVMESKFTPAIQANHPIDCWVSLPVVFVMR